MKLLLKILFFLLAIFHTNISKAKVVVFSNVISEINFDENEVEHKNYSIHISVNDFGITCKSESVLLDYRNLVSVVKATAAKGGLTAYETALAGGKHSGFLKNYLGRNADEIGKSIKSMQSGNQGISIHLDKIANPTKYVPNWNTLRPSHQQSLINGWQNTVTKHTEQIQILQTILGK